MQVCRVCGGPLRAGARVARCMPAHGTKYRAVAAAAAAAAAAGFVTTCCRVVGWCVRVVHPPGASCAQRLCAGKATACAARLGGGLHACGSRRVHAGAGGKEGGSRAAGICGGARRCLFTRRRRGGALYLRAVAIRSRVAVCGSGLDGLGVARGGHAGLRRSGCVGHGWGGRLAPALSSCRRPTL